MTPNMDNDGPSDEEASSLASHSNLQPPAVQPKQPSSHREKPLMHANEEEFAAIPASNNSSIGSRRQQKQPMNPQNNNSSKIKRVTKEERGRHEGKIIEISTSPPPSTKQKQGHYESFFPMHNFGRSRSTSVEEVETKRESIHTGNTNTMSFRKTERGRDRRHRSKSSGTPSRKQVLRARQVLVHYHPQLGDEGYESTLLESSSSSSLHLKKFRGGFSSPLPPPPPPPPPQIIRQDGTTSKYEKQWNKGGGINSRMIDDFRFEEGGGGNDEFDNAATRQLRRRVLRMTLEGRSISAEENRRRMRSAEEDVGGPSFEGERMNAVHGHGYVEAASGTSNESAVVHPGGVETVHATPEECVMTQPSLQRLTISTRPEEEEEEGDIPLPTPNRRSTPQNMSSPSSYNSSRPPPPPPNANPSYRQIVAQLIQTNEPEKLSQLDRVLQKYLGREEELIAKLDLRYRKKKKKKKKTSGDDVVVMERNVQPTSPEDESSMENVVRHSPRKDRNAILMMQSWDRKHDEKEYDDDDDDNEQKNATTKSNSLTVTSVMERAEQDERNDSNVLAFSTRTSSTRTELHSNLERDVEDSEGRLPKVPESEARVPENDHRNTPTRAKDGEKSMPCSPGFNDDISLITMETKGTMYRNRGEGGIGGAGGEGGEVVYSYAEMMRRPPASIIVDGNASAQPPQDSPASMEKDIDDNAKFIQQQQQQLAPPKIQRLLPEYEKMSEQERADAAEASEATSAKLDSVEARIRARHELRREEEARKLEDDKGDQSMTTKTLEEQSTMAFDEEESFVGKSNGGGQRSVIEHSSSLIDDEVIRRGVFNGKYNSGKEEKDAMEDLHTVVEENSFLGKYRIDDKDHQKGTAQPVSAHFFEGEFLLDRKSDFVPDNVAEECVEEGRSVQVNTKAVEDDSNDDLARTQRDEERARAIQEAARRDAEIQLQKMQDEIARLVAEKESRFAAEKAVALKKAEKALEEERKARFEAEEARLKAEKELVRLKAVAEERAMLMEAAKVAELLRAEKESQSERMYATAEERSMSIIDESKRSWPNEIIEENEKSISMNKERTMPLKQDSKETPVKRNTATIQKSMSMDAETKEELMSMIAKMEERSTSLINDPSVPDEMDDKDQLNDEGDDSVDIVEKMRAVWASDDDESRHAEYGACSHDEPEYENQDDHVAQSSNTIDDDNENDSDHSDDHSYLPGSLQSSPERKSKTISKDLHDFPSLTMPQVPLNLASLEDTMKLQRSVLLKNDHDFPSTTMPHRQVSAAQILDTTEPRSLDAKVTPSLQNDLPRRPSLIDDEEGEANIFHVARVTFDGDPSKGQLSFTTGSEVLAHSNQRGDWWLGRCGGRTGWFPAAAVVPSSEFLRGPFGTAYNPVQNAEDDDDIDLEFPKLSEEELSSVYDFIRSPSGDDDSPKRVRKDFSPPTSPTLNPSQCIGQEQRRESTKSDESDVTHAFDSMMNVYDSMVTPASTRDSDHQIKEKEEPSLTVLEENNQTEANYNIQVEANDTKQTETNQERPLPTAQEKKPKRMWRSALDPNTGLTYYYHVKTRETTWDKPPGFVEKKSPAKSPSSVESKPIAQDSGPKESTAKESSKSGSKRFLGLFSKPSGKSTHSSPNSVSDRKAIHSTVPQNAKPTYERRVATKTHISNNVVSSPCDYSEEEDATSVSSEETSTSIFSTKRMREAIVKVTSKIAGKITTIPTNNSYDVLDRSPSQKVDRVKNMKTVEKLPGANAKEETKEEIQPYEDRDKSNRQVTQNRDRETTTSASDTASVQPASHGKKNGSRWRAAIDPLTGRTYYFHKDTQETVWEKPKDL